MAIRFGLVTLEPSGGTGRWRFAVVEDGSGAWIDGWSGTYLAGDLAPATDVVELSDEGCVGTATLGIDVLTGMTVEPANPSVAPGATLTFAISGGSGTWGCSLVENDTTATVEAPCAYEAGGVEGIDVLRVEDGVTGERIDRAIVVDEASGFSLSPPEIFLPIGEAFAPDVETSTGGFAIVPVAGDAASWDGSRFHGHSPGRAEFRAEDPFTGEGIDVAVEVVEPLDITLTPTGDSTLHGHMRAADFDSDGWTDLLFGWPEDDLLAFNGGGVRLFAGSEAGLDPTPVQAFGTEGSGDQSGRSLAIGDWNGDGNLDLAFGAPFADSNGGDAGSVRIHDGSGALWFDDLPSVSWAGTHSGDRLGDALASCDWNGDGYADLAIGATRDEDRVLDPDPDDQGLVRIHLGGASGLSAAPWRELWGRLPDAAGGWNPAPGLRFGSTLQALDWNGDGACDLAVGAREWSTASGRGNDGGVFLFLGSGGELGADPVLAWAGVDPMPAGAEVGRTLAAGDLDGDGRDELIVGAREHDDPARSGNNHGGVWIAPGDVAPAAPILIIPPLWDLPWSRLGDQGGDALGASLLVVDAEDDGQLDLWIGSHGGEVEGGPGDTGTVGRLSPGVGALPQPLWSELAGGLASGDAFGLSFALLRAGSDPRFAVFAPRDDTGGFHAGALAVLNPGAGTLQPLALPLQPSGTLWGQAVAWVGDLDGDGISELLAGAPKADSRLDRADDGRVVLFRGTSSGVEAEPWATLDPLLTIDGGDEWGYAAAALSDFDGDGLDDFAVVARQDDRPSSFDPALFQAASCSGNAGGTGAVFLFLGRADGEAPTAPSFAWYGPQGGATVPTLHGGGDWNGDGLSDLAVGLPFTDDPANEAGRVDILFGRPASGLPGTEVICDASFTYLAGGGDRELGRAVAFVPDLDGDGCDELLAGAPKEDRGLSNQGALHLLWGTGAPTCRGEATVTVLAGSDGDARLGSALDAGPDIDGDGLADAAVGATNLQVEGDRRGGAFVLRGQWLQGLPSVPVADADSSLAWPLADVLDRLTILGGWHEGLAGRALALSPATPGERPAGLWMAEPLGGRGGSDRAGGLCLFPLREELSAWRIESEPLTCVAGDDGAPGSRLGESLALRADGAALVAGGPVGDGPGTDAGIVFVVPLRP